MRSINLCGETLPHAGHVCAFFDSREQKYETLIPFLQDAISAGDSVINIVDDCDKAAHLDTLQRDGVPVGQAMGNGMLRLFTSEQTYLQPGQETLPRLLGFLRKELEKAKDENHCLRTWGEMNWIERNEVPMRQFWSTKRGSTSCSPISSARFSASTIWPRSQQCGWQTSS